MRLSAVLPGHGLKVREQKLFWMEFAQAVRFFQRAVTHVEHAFEIGTANLWLDLGDHRDLVQLPRLAGKLLARSGRAPPLQMLSTINATVSVVAPKKRMSFPTL